MNESIPYGYCHCGCGNKAPVAGRNRTKSNHVQGMPMKYIRGHGLNTVASRYGKTSPGWKSGRTIDNHGYVRIWNPAHLSSNSRGYILEHILIVEQTLEYQLPDKAVIHHVNGIPNDNKRNNLVICENHAYHKLLHQRTRALQSSGHGDWRKCWICKKYDDPKNLYIKGHSPYHNHCIIERRKNGK